jgi:hypothetical protein
LAPLPPRDLPDPTLEAADRALEARERAQPKRQYLGMSAIGHPCSRKLWYDYHGVVGSPHPADTLKKFADGHASEDVIINRLRLVPGITLLSVDPDTGRQYGFSDFDGKFRGHMDGVIHGLLQAPATWHVFEAKATAEKNFEKLKRIAAEVGEKNALQVWNETYWAQAQLYMGYADLERHYLVACTPGARDWTSVRTDFDAAAFAALKDKAQRILTARAPLARISNDPAWYQCRWCDHHVGCHGVAP